MAASSTLMLASLRRCGSEVERVLAERDARAAELSARDSRAALREARLVQLAASSAAERREADARYRQLLRDFRSAERGADEAWRRFCRVIDDR